MDTSSSDTYQLILKMDTCWLLIDWLVKTLWMQILALLNEIPATSRKYQFAMAMAERIMDENARSGHVDMIQVNRLALSSAFSRTSTLLHRSLMRTQNDNEEDGGSTWMSRAIRAIPMGTYVAPYLKGIRMCLGAVRSCMEMATSCWQKQGRKMVRVGGGDHQGEEEMAEKLAEEMVWISIKLRDYEALDEAMVQWSLASSLASLSLYANPRVQGLILKISGSLSLFHFCILAYIKLQCHFAVLIGLVKFHSLSYFFIFIFLIIYFPRFDEKYTFLLHEVRIIITTTFKIHF